MCGDFPPKGIEIDHIDGCRSNNAWSNLRMCSKAENHQNRRTTSKSFSGLIGVSLSRTGKWDSRITRNRITHNLGSYETKEEAHQAYLDKKRELHEFNPSPRKDQ
ncbi:hypothetical protein D3C85_1519120 [compost metagenome]